MHRTTKIGTVQVGPAHVGPAQVGLTQVGPVQVGPVQVGICQMGYIQYCPPQLGARADSSYLAKVDLFGPVSASVIPRTCQHCPFQVGAPQVSSLEVSPIQAGVPQVGASQVGASQVGVPQSPPMLGQTVPPAPGTITVTASVSDTLEDWVFVFALNDGSLRAATKAVPTVGWSDLAPNQVYTLTQYDPGAEWRAAVFTCTRNGSPIADADPESSGFELFLGAGDSVACAITNSMYPQRAVRMEADVIRGRIGARHTCRR